MAFPDDTAAGRSGLHPRWLALFLLVLLTGCAGRPTLETHDAATLSMQQVLIVSTAKNALGAPYQWGGVTLKGLDCSGLTQLSYRTAGITLPRTSNQQFQSLPRRDNARPGDLLFFGPHGRATHVGIYIGDQQMVHAPGTGRTVRVSNITKRYWRHHFLGAAGPRS